MSAWPSGARGSGICSTGGGRTWTTTSRPGDSGWWTALCAIETDTVVVTHFVAINVAVGWATGDDRVVTVSPDNGSVTAIEREAGVARVAAAPG